MGAGAVTTYAHLVCGHIRPCEDTVREGQLIACYRCGVEVLVERIGEAKR